MKTGHGEAFNVCIRRTDGALWADMKTTSSTSIDGAGSSVWRAERQDKENPFWAKGNPVVAVGTFKLEAVAPLRNLAGGTFRK